MNWNISKLLLHTHSLLLSSLVFLSLSHLFIIVKQIIILLIRSFFASATPPETIAYPPIHSMTKPAITVPMGYEANGKPKGLTFIGKRLSEKQLLEYAFAYEQATKKRRSPKNYD